jgi:hypothetical protein
MAFDGVPILHLAGEGVGLGDQLAGHAHVDVAVSAPEAIFDHGVNHFCLAEAKTFAGLGQEVRRAAHGLHAAGYDDFGRAGEDCLGGEGDGFEAASTDHVDCEGADSVGEAAAEGGLAGGVLTEAGGENAAHDAFVDGFWGEGSAADSFADGDSAEVDGAEVAERTEEFAHGGADGAYDCYVFHGEYLGLMVLEQMQQVSGDSDRLTLNAAAALSLSR